MEVPSDDGSVESRGAPFNIALASLQRLHFLKMDASNARRQRYVNDWITILDSELSEMQSMVELNKEQEKLVEDVRKKFYGLVRLHNNNASCFKRGVDGGKQVEVCSHDSDAFFALSEYETVLSKLQFAHKLMMPGKDDPRSAFK